MMDDHVFMTYAEASAALGIKQSSVKRRAAAKKWPKRMGNDGLARVGIPREIIPEKPRAPDAIPPDATPDPTPEIIARIATLTAENAQLRERLDEAKDYVAAARADADAARADRDAWKDMADRLANRGALSMIFGRRRADM